ncbi:hypothetical protein AB432_001975 [Brevibacillus brevis]|uniref:Uncharacterized protein n=1 Tax=Brevibacillus brevis TaxID=1393 RepID=A0A2Z4MBQ0_BREBE|nr:hypothetical protein AB432_001975 [Brevibacillus brevis]
MLYTGTPTDKSLRLEEILFFWPWAVDKGEFWSYNYLKFKIFNFRYIVILLPQAGTFLYAIIFNLRYLKVNEIEKIEEEVP